MMHSVLSDIFYHNRYIFFFSLGALAVGGVLMGTGLSIGYMSLQHVLATACEVEAVSAAMWGAALGVTAVSVVSKELLFHYTLYDRCGELLIGQLILV